MLIDGVCLSLQADNVAVLLEELQWLLQQDSAAWQQLLEGLRQRADAFDPPDAYDAHMEMGFLLATR